MEFREFMMTEMPLSSYRTRFVRADRSGDSFRTGPDGTVDPATQVDAKGDPINYRFSLKDRRVITHPRTVKVLEERLARTGYRFNILLLEGGVGGVGGEDSRLGRYRERVEGFMRKSGVEREGHITFAKNATSGHVLTPWMVLHTLGHAVSEHAERVGIRLYDTVFKVLRRLPEGRDGPINPLGRDGDERTNLGHVLMFRSVQGDMRGDGHASSAELVHELVAEYLWNGGEVRIRPPFHMDERVYEVVSSVERMVEEALDSCVGEVVFDHS